jgi:hypothetical protein
MSKKDEKETRSNPDGGFLGDIKQKAEGVMSQAGSLFGKPKDEEEKKDKFKKKYDDDERKFKNKKDDDDDDDDD